MNRTSELGTRLLRVLNELKGQREVSTTFLPEELPFDEAMKQIREFIELAGEYGIAYESLVATIESHPFVLSGKAAISLLEVGLLLGFKTGRDSDQMFQWK